MVFTQWEHTSTAFGEFGGCNFKIRVGAPASTPDEIFRLQKEAYRLSRIIDHVSLEKDIPFFRTNIPTLENIAKFLYSQMEVPGIVQVDGNENFIAAAGDKTTGLIFNFTARNARRVMNIELTLTGFISPVHGMVIERETLKDLVHTHFQIPEIIFGVTKDDGLAGSFNALKDALLPRKLVSITIRDAVDSKLLLGWPQPSLPPQPQLDHPDNNAVEA